MTESQETLSNLLQENRRFEPPAELAAAANVTASAYTEASADRLAFWEAAADRLTWAERWHTTLEWEAPFAKWFVGGKLNIAYNCVDRHVEAGNGDKVAFYWEGEPEGDSRVITYADLQKEVSKAANALTELGVGKGDRVAIYMPMIPELPVSLLACARIGAIHSVVFGGFSASALKSRIDDADAKLVITADGGFRRGRPARSSPPWTRPSRSARRSRRCSSSAGPARTSPSPTRTSGGTTWSSARATSTPPSPTTPRTRSTSSTPSGTTGKPKGILHTTGGYLTQTAWTHNAVSDLKPDTDIYWCTADIGWVTGHSYIVYGPLANGATSVIYEGTPDTPHRGRFWEIVQKYKVTILYTAPTAIRTFMKWGDDIPAKFDMSVAAGARVGRRADQPEAYVWYREHIGASRTPVVDTWWQTETGAITISPLPGVTAGKPGAASNT